MDRLWTVDPRALNHVLTHSSDYPKPEMARSGLATLFGEGKCSRVYDAYSHTEMTWM